MFDRSTATRTALRKKLGRKQFEQICSRAASYSTNCEEYICRVLANLRAWITSPADLERQRPEKAIKTNGKNIQTCVIEIYYLLDQKCAYDFDVTEVLNSYSDEALDSY